MKRYSIHCGAGSESVELVATRGNPNDYTHSQAAEDAEKIGEFLSHLPVETYEMLERMMASRTIASV